MANVLHCSTDLRTSCSFNNAAKIQGKHTQHTHKHRHTQREKGQTKWLASQKAVHNVICIYILARAPCLQNTEGNNAANAAWQHTTPFLHPFLPPRYLHSLLFAVSLWVVPLHFCGICIISSMSYVSALCALRLLRWLCASRGSAGVFCNHRHYQVA